MSLPEPKWWLLGAQALQAAGSTLHVSTTGDLQSQGPSEGTQGLHLCPDEQERPASSSCPNTGLPTAAEVTQRQTPKQCLGQLLHCCCTLCAMPPSPVSSHLPPLGVPASQIRSSRTPYGITAHTLMHAQAHTRTPRFNLALQRRCVQRGQGTPLNHVALRELWGGDRRKLSQGPGHKLHPLASDPGRHIASQ